MPQNEKLQPGTDEYWNVNFATVKAHFDQATEYKQIRRLKLQANKLADSDAEGWCWGAVEHFYKEKKAELKPYKPLTPEEARIKMLLYTTSRRRRGY